VNAFYRRASILSKEEGHGEAIEMPWGARIMVLNQSRVKKSGEKKKLCIIIRRTTSYAR